MTAVLTADAIDRSKRFIEQYGVKGMRWGVRRSDAQLSEIRKDPNPFDIDKPAVLGHTQTNSGYRADGTPYQGWKANDSLSYTKFADGSKRVWSGNTVIDIPPPKEVKHDDSVVEFLAHYGIKGMRWGVRRSDAQLARARKGGDPEDITLTYKPGGKVKTAGGANHPPSEDYKRARVAAQKARESGTASLSNQEMQAFVARANLEAQYAQVVARQSSTQKNAAVAFIQDLALDVGKQQSKQLANKYAKAGIKVLEKKAKKK